MALRQGSLAWSVLLYLLPIAVISGFTYFVLYIVVYGRRANAVSYSTMPEADLSLMLGWK